MALMQSRAIRVLNKTCKTIQLHFQNCQVLCMVIWVLILSMDPLLISWGMSKVAVLLLIKNNNISPILEEERPMNELMKKNLKKVKVPNSSNLPHRIVLEKRHSQYNNGWLNDHLVKYMEVDLKKSVNRSLLMISKSKMSH
jgi:hypothetical protein